MWRFMCVALSFFAMTACDAPGGDGSGLPTTSLDCRSDGIYREGKELVDFDFPLSPAQMGASGWEQKGTSPEGEVLYQCKISGYKGSSYSATCDGETCAYPTQSSSGSSSVSPSSSSSSGGGSCSLSCWGDYDGFSVGLSCGTSSRTCTKGYNGFGQLNRLSCIYSNGRAFNCNLSYNGLGQASGTCNGEGDTCRF